MNRKFLYSILALVLLFPLACRSLNQITPAPLDNAAIEAEVRTSIAQDESDKALAIEVTVDDGTVTLSGHANSQDQKTRIGNAANDVKGVKRVINNIHVE